MRTLAVSLLLLSACAAAPVKPARWPAALVFSVVGGCGRSGLGSTLRECGCFAEQLERVSPDPATEATPAEVQAAAAACGLEAPKPEIEGGTDL